MRNAAYLSLAALLTAGLLLTGCGPKNDFVPPPPPEVTVARPAIKTVTLNHRFPGRLRAKETVEIRARVSGYLQSVLFEDGDRAEQGTPLFIIEPATYQAALQAAEAALLGAYARQGIASNNYARREIAFRTRAISEIDLLKAKADLDAAMADVQARTADLDRAKLNLSYTTNRAPVAGRLGRKLVSEGNLVGGANPTLLTTLVVEDPIHLYFFLDERLLLRFLQRHPRGTEPAPREAPRVQLETGDGEVYPLKGQIDFMDNQVDPDTGTMEVRAVFPNSEGRLAPGLFATVLIPEVQTNAVTLPELAVQRDIGGPYVLVVDAEDKVLSQPVKPGAKVGSELIIEEGLEGDERVVVNGLMQARPGAKVRPSPAGQDAPPARGNASTRSPAAE